MSWSPESERRLRAALRAAADSVQPGGDGLQRIRARGRHRRAAPGQAALAAVADLWWGLFQRAPAALQDWLFQLAASARVARARLAPAGGPAATGARSWLRPLAAMALVTAIVAVGAYAAIDSASPQVFQSSATASSGGGHQPGGHTPRAHPSLDVRSATPYAPTTQPPPQRPSPACSPAPHPRTTPSPSATPSTSATPSSPPASTSPKATASPSSSSISPPPSASPGASASTQPSPSAANEPGSAASPAAGDAGDAGDAASVPTAGGEPDAVAATPELTQPSDTSPAPATSSTGPCGSGGSGH